MDQRRFLTVIPGRSQKLIARCSRNCSQRPGQSGSSQVIGMRFPAANASDAAPRLCKCARLDRGPAANTSEAAFAAHASDAAPRLASVLARTAGLRPRLTQMTPLSRLIRSDVAPRLASGLAWTAGLRPRLTQMTPLSRLIQGDAAPRLCKCARLDRGLTPAANANEAAFAAHASVVAFAADKGTRIRRVCKDSRSHDPDDSQIGKIGYLRFFEVRFFLLTESVDW